MVIVTNNGSRTANALGAVESMVSFTQSSNTEWLYKYQHVDKISVMQQVTNDVDKVQIVLVIVDHPSR